MMVWLYYTSIIILLGGEFNYRTYLTLTKKQEMKFKQIDNEDLYEE
jgi:uncharacterized BrkB/YihY/UPF0761 family membrane protein